MIATAESASPSQDSEVMEDFQRDRENENFLLYILGGIESAFQFIEALHSYKLIKAYFVKISIIEFGSGLNISTYDLGINKNRSYRATLLQQLQYNSSFELHSLSQSNMAHFQ